jgi:hypothetical protein
VAKNDANAAAGELDAALEPKPRKVKAAPVK